MVDVSTNETEDQDENVYTIPPSDYVKCCASINVKSQRGKLLLVQPVRTTVMKMKTYTYDLKINVKKIIMNNTLRIIGLSCVLIHCR